MIKENHKKLCSLKTLDWNSKAQGNQNEAMVSSFKIMKFKQIICKLDYRIFRHNLIAIEAFRVQTPNESIPIINNIKCTPNQ